MSNKKKTTPKAKEPIKLRSKQLANGNHSLYLDFYKDGKREYEFLKLYLVLERSPIDKSTNAQTLELANTIKAQKIVELQNAAHGFSVSKTKAKVNVIDYIQTIADKKRAKAGGKERGAYQNYMALSRHITAYSGNKTIFRHVDKKYCEGFLSFLATATNLNRGQTNKPLNENTQHIYMKHFESVLNAAISDEIILINPFKQIKTAKPKKQKSEVIYLSIDEVKMLENTPCLNPTVKQAFLFSCYTGLRFSDVAALTWGKLQTDSNGGTFINFVQEKTAKREYLPIPNKAVGNLPDRADASDNDKVFSLSSGGYVNLQLRQWAFMAGVKKHIHFHVARHTYATLLLTKEVPIETVSKNLGHSEIRTTQIYAKVINQAQREAVNKLDEI